jgi:ribosomal protein L11 methyltransferase
MLYEIEFPLGTLNPAAVEDTLTEIGALSITFSDRGDEPVLEPKPGEVRLWSDTRVRALFDESHDALESLTGLAERLGPEVAAGASVRGVESRDWERVWLEDWTALRFGTRLWICPTTEPPPKDPEAVVVRLDPGLAFGTGTHPTTAMCLETIDALALDGRSVVDYGCGSGILGIAALKLGARRVVAVDLDPQALVATRENAVRNGVSDRLDTREVGAALAASDLVCANILAEPLIELKPVLTAACAMGGDLILSGILKSQAPRVLAAYGSHFDMVRVLEREDWCCIRARRTS